MLSVRRFFSAIRKDWLARMSGPLTVPFTILAFFLPSAAGKILFAILAVVAALITSYRVYKSEYDRAESLEKQLLELLAKDKQSAITSADWTELADKFEKIGLDVSVQWQCSRKNNQTIFESWSFSGTYRKPCETLCRFAGTLLAKSPNVSRTLSELALHQSDPAWRWLSFLKENHNALDHGGGLPPTGDDGTIYLGGRISNVAAVSARVCMECAALEL